MSIKENVEYIKQEISAEESFMENIIQIEKFYKKYKKVIIGGVVLFVVGLIGFNISSYLANQKQLKANQAFNKILQHNFDQTALNTLQQTNPKLYQIALYLQQKDTKAEFLKELNIYAKAIESNNIKQLNSSIENDKFLIKDFAIFNKALILAQNKKYKQAKDSLKFIQKDSSLAPLVKLLQHYLITK